MFCSAYTVISKILGVSYGLPPNFHRFFRLLFVAGVQGAFSLYAVWKIGTRPQLVPNYFLGTKDLPDYLVGKRRSTGNTPLPSRIRSHLKEAKDSLEKEVLESTLAESNWNKSIAARRLGISRPQLYSLIKKHNSKRRTGEAS
jgi:hypothetical protein